MIVLALPSCGKEELTRVSFKIKAQGFSLESAMPDEKGDFAGFTHRLSGGSVTFTRGQKVYEFELFRAGIEEYTFEVPVGTYEMEIDNPLASLYGQRGGSFISEPTTVEIHESTDTLTIQVVANCALFLVRDDSEQLEDGAFMIRRFSYSQGYFTPYPLSKDDLTGLYFAYFTPDTTPSDPSAFLWFHDDRPGEVDGGLPTYELEAGYQYFVSILE